jgi:hypothetical protein
MCGGINTTVWPSVDQLPLFNKMNLSPDKKRVLDERMTQIIVKSESMPASGEIRNQVFAAFLRMHLLSILEH